MGKPEPLKIKPYARLLTMLGDQLIKNERIALIELIKNSYDADAKWVKVTFEGFGDNYETTDSSKIIIEDSGHGMTRELIKTHWLNPATPEKKRRKAIKETTDLGRIIQGEKGIGRFAILKLGNKIKVITRAVGNDEELEIDYDFSMYDNDFLNEKVSEVDNDGNETVKHIERDLFIEDLTVHLHSRKPKLIVPETVTLGIHKENRPANGTRIEISGLKGSWTKRKVEDAFLDVTKLESIFPDLHKKNDEAQKKAPDFKVYFYKDNKVQSFHKDYIERLNFLLEEKPVVKIENGRFDEGKQEFRFIQDGSPRVLKLEDAKVKGLMEHLERFGLDKKALKRRKSECGSFKFGLYVFDLSKGALPKFQLDDTDKEIVRDHRIYLYRDGIRVYPYGEPEDDWLLIDAYRGTRSLGTFLSNDQVVGYVDISHKNNPQLKDKTNREGLIEEGNATSDFIALLQILLAHIRQKPYSIYLEKLKEKDAQNIFREKKVQHEFDALKVAVKDNKKARDLVTKVEKEYKAEKKYLVRRAETTEDLAAIGLSVETASHDIMSVMEKAMNNMDALLQDILHEDIDVNELGKELQSIRGAMSFIEAQLKDVQLLFTSSKKRRRPIKVKEIIEKVERIYRRLLKKEAIQFVINEIGSPLTAKTTDAVLLQLFLNLIDNSVFWLQQIEKEHKQIEITLDGRSNQMIFSDNGPGVDEEDKPYIFNSFYSGKGDEGRGLGLYIARQLLERHDYSIELADISADKILSGANFVVSFVQEE